MVRMLVAGLLAACGLVLVTPSTSYACSCAGGTQSDFVDWADVLFTGTLTDIEPPPQRELMSSTDPNTYTFIVHRVFEGEAGLATEVESAMSGASCGLEGMEVGEEYVVFATHHRGALVSGLCSGTGRAGPGLVEQLEQLTGPSRAYPPGLGWLLAALTDLW